MKILCHIATVLIFVLILVTIFVLGSALATINTTYEVGQMVHLKTGGMGMVIGNGYLTGYHVRVGTKKVWFKEFELEEL